MVASWWATAALLLSSLLQQPATGHALVDPAMHITSFEDVLAREPRADEFAIVDHVSVTSRHGSIAADDALFPDWLDVTLTTQGIDLAFQVALKRDLLDPNVQMFAHDGPEQVLMASPRKPKHIAYAATLPGGGYARLTMFADQSFHATIKLPQENKMLVVDPIAHHLAYGHEKDNAHHRLTESPTGLVSYTLPLHAAQVSGHRQLTEWGRMAACNWPAMQLSVGVASDAGFTAQHGGAGATQSYLIAVYNSINGLYDDQIGVHLVLGTFLIETTTGGPSWNVAPPNCGSMADIQTQLTAMQSWVAASGIPLCGNANCGTWHLHTHCDADPLRTGNTAGLAWVGTLCSASMGYNTGVSIDGGAQTWIIVGHEIGHNFNAQHTFTQGGIMSYDWTTPMKFYDDGRVCTFVQTVLNKCLTPYSPTAPPPPPTAAPTTTTTTRAPTTTAAPATTDTPTTTVVGTTSMPTSSAPASTGPATTTLSPPTDVPTSTSVAPISTIPSTTTSPPPTPNSTTPSGQDPCACAMENLCHQANRPGCRRYLDKRYCYVVGYSQCPSATKSATCTNAQGQPLYYVEFDGDCPRPPSPVAPTPSPSYGPPTSPTPPCTGTKPATPAPSPATTVSSSPSPPTSPTTPLSTTAPPLTPTTTTTAVSQQDPCACATTNLCRQANRPGCRYNENKRFCYVVGYAQCPGAKKSTVCTNDQGQPLYYLEFDRDCPIPSTVNPTPMPSTTAASVPSTTLSTPCGGETSPTPCPQTTPPPATPPSGPCSCSRTSKCPTIPDGGCKAFDGQGWCFVTDPHRCTGAQYKESTDCPGQKFMRCNVTASPTTASPLSTTAMSPAATTTTTPCPVTTPSSSTPPPSTNPCGCSQSSKCPTVPHGGCESFNGQGWCYVNDPHKCFGDAYYESTDCAGQKYKRCDASTSAPTASPSTSTQSSNGTTTTPSSSPTPRPTLPPPPRDPCACSSTPVCPNVSSQPGCFATNRSSFCYVQDPAKCNRVGVLASTVCPSQKIRLCWSGHKSATHWVVSQWGKCSAECGGGVKNRTVQCMDRFERTTFTDGSCTATKPLTTIPCNVRSCPTTAFNNTTPCAGPPHSTCQPRGLRKICDCACNDGFVYHPRRRECVRLPSLEFENERDPNSPGDMYGPNSFEVRSHDLGPLDPTICDGREEGSGALSGSWAAFDPTDGPSTESTKPSSNAALIAIATCIAAIALALVVLAYRRKNALRASSGAIQTPVYIVGATPNAML
ncbi:Aste57867_11895 [Aphanomyces stellatus]|uniref:Aste57867_11895 protein n=1 Tax=Aphanomyces stellatus TaxID=120398 RepID=A0A485KUU3_9STRA|nr:hypothetical protein As57867_011850 [Aphanomyces stellatus]VFT88750.1 Aste57867_11895 [Aphanomyces stellatus]